MYLKGNFIVNMLRIEEILGFFCLKIICPVIVVADQPSSEAAVFLSEVRAPPVRTPNAPPDNASNVKALASILRRTLDEPHYPLKRTAEIGKNLLSKCTQEEKNTMKKML